MTRPTTLLNATDTAAALPYPELADAIGSTLKASVDGQVHALERATAPLPGDGTFLLMGAADRELAIAKIGAVHPGNTSRGLPTILASVVITDATTGEMLSIADGATVTVRRTSALSLYGAQQVGATGHDLFVVGAGAQAFGHLEALHAGFGVERLWVASRTASKAAALVRHAQALGIEAALVADDEAALASAAQADMIVTATNSYSPVLSPELVGRLKPSATILAVGAFRPDMAEVPPGLVAATDVVVDTLEGAREEAGDLIQAAAAGAWRWEEARDLAGILPGFERSGRPVLFKSVGHSMWDLAAARLVASRTG